MANWWDEAPLAGAAPATSAEQSPFAGAISSIESGSQGGNYKLVGPVTRTGDRALGRYQVMGANIGPWSEEILGRRITPQEFMASPEIQDTIFNGKFGQYAQKYGPEGAAKAWFAGEGGMNNPNARDVLGTSVSSYANKFNRALGSTDVSAQSKPAKNWWDDAPLATEAPKQDAPAPSDGTQLEAGANGGPKRLVMDMTPKKPDAGYIDAAARGFGSGITGNFTDEISGLQGAAPGIIKDYGGPVTKSIAGAARLAAHYLTGLDPEALTNYQKDRDETRALNEAAKENYPITSVAGNVAGALALPMGGAAAAGVLPRIAQGALVGAGAGALSGAGEGEGFADSATKAGVGGVVGGALGGAIPAVTEGVVRGARALATPIANTVRGIRNVDDEAARRAMTAIQRDIQADPAAVSRLTPAEYAASVQSGGPARTMDLGGETTRALARSAANTSPEGRAAMNRNINDRFEGQGSRVIDWLRNTFHYPNAEAQQEAIEKTRKTVNNVNYKAAMQAGDRPIFSPELDRLMGSPAVVDAMKRASVSGKDRAITEGLGAMRQGVTVENGVVTFTRGKSGAPTYPNLAFWDATKKEIDDSASAAARAGRNSEAGVLRDLARTLRDELDNHVPSYKQARAGHAHFAGAENALEAGQNFVSMNMSAHEARRLLTQMTPQERQLFQDGFVSQFVDKLNQVGDRRSILNKIAESPAAREKLNIALGHARATELEAVLRVEGIMDLARNAVQGNSTTARQLAELGLAGGTYLGLGGGVNPFTDPGAAVNAALVYGAAKGRNSINEKLSRRVAEMLVSNDPNVVTRGIQTIARNQNLFNSLRAADRGIARVGGNQAPAVPALQSMGVGRADDQPDVPGPSGQ